MIRYSPRASIKTVYDEVVGNFAKDNLNTVKYILLVDTNKKRNMVKYNITEAVKKEPNRCFFCAIQSVFGRKITGRDTFGVEIIHQ
jgi:hypothetical protein